jgi:hypothetical protein
MVLLGRVVKYVAIGNVSMAFERHGILAAVVTRSHKSAFLRGPLIEVYVFNNGIMKYYTPIAVVRITNYFRENKHYPNQ